MNYTLEARALKDRGVSVVPLRTDGSKLPKIKWAIYQTRLMSDAEIDEHFTNCGGVAAITGNISNLYVFDFDLKYQHDTQDFWKAFMAKVPEEMKRRMYINTTRNNGFHVWVRTDYEDKSRKLTRRANTLPELMERYAELIADGIEPLKASENILKSPFEVVIETRSRGSYAVFCHVDYTKVYGKKLQSFTKEEVVFLNEIAYSLDFAFNPEKVYTGKVRNFSSIKKYNEDASVHTILELLESTGMFTYVETERGGNIKILRRGSKAKYSGKIYVQNSVLHLFTENSIFSTLNKSSFSPFEVYMVTKSLTQEQAIAELQKESNK